MPYLVVKNDTSVLARTEPSAPLSWLDINVSEATDHRYAIIFDTFRGAALCAPMHGAEVHQIGDWGS